MDDGIVLYLPKDNEPSVFTTNPDEVNDVWIEYWKPHLLGRVKQIPRFGQAKNVGDRMVRDYGETIKRKIVADLVLTIPDNIIPVPDTMLTSDGHISLLWVMHMAREDKMSPEEAYAYSLALKRGM
jgi:hypothetical protein